MSSDSTRPVPAARKRTTAPGGGQSTGLLINVIRSLTSSVSEDQRELEKTRLEKGFRESEALIDRLVKDHQNDVEECLDTIRDVSTRISSCLERIHNVRNALHTCKSLLENRRDDLKKLWIENAQQRYICEIMTQLEELRDAPLRVDIAIAAGDYQEAARIVSASRDLLGGQLSAIEGLSHLRTTLQMSAQTLAPFMVEEVVGTDPSQDCTMSELQESQLFETARLIPHDKSLESSCSSNGSFRGSQLH